MKKLLMIMCMVATMLSICVVPSFADCAELPGPDDGSISLYDVTNKRYYKENVMVDKFEGTGAAYKETASKVYVNPTVSSGYKTKVKTLCYVAGVPTNKTANADYITCAVGKKYAITNYVYEQGDYTNNKGVDMWLGVSPTVYGDCGGWWSPDWTGTGEVIIV